MSGAPVRLIAGQLSNLAELEAACFLIGARDARFICAGLRLMLAGIVETESDPGTPEHNAALDARGLTAPEMRTETIGGATVTP